MFFHKTRIFIVIVSNVSPAWVAGRSAMTTIPAKIIVIHTRERHFIAFLDVPPFASGVAVRWTGIFFVSGNDISIGASAALTPVDSLMDAALFHAGLRRRLFRPDSVVVKHQIFLTPRMMMMEVSRPGLRRRLDGWWVWSYNNAFLVL